VAGVQGGEVEESLPGVGDLITLGAEPLEDGGDEAAGGHLRLVWRQILGEGEGGLGQQVAAPAPVENLEPADPGVHCPLHLGVQLLVEHGAIVPRV